MDLRKFTLVVFLNDGLDLQGTDAPIDRMGSLRLYTEGDTFHGVVDVHPRIGRAVLFKSEEMLHQVMSSRGWDNYALTFYFT